MDNPVFKLEGVVHERSAETLQDFEGPLDLILFLLSKNKIEIQDIQISAILEQYLAYLDEMKRLFSLWRLDSYIVEMTDNEEMFFKEGAIQRYLDAHPAVENYVILDDISMRKAFPGHDVVTPDILDEESYRQALHILNHWTKELGHEHHLP